VIVALQVPYADTTAADLGFAWGLPPQPALHVLDLPDVAGAGTHLQLRLLGASHQAVLTLAGGPVTETVACLPAAGLELPSRPVTVDLPGGWRYSFSVRVDRCAAGPFAEQVRAVRRASAHGTAMVGEFPGTPGAVTALSASVDGTRDRRAPSLPALAWWTVHAYPQSGEIVRTRTRVRPA